MAAKMATIMGFILQMTYIYEIDALHTILCCLFFKWTCCCLYFKRSQDVIIDIFVF